MRLMKPTCETSEMSDQSSIYLLKQLNRSVIGTLSVTLMTLSVGCQFGDDNPSQDSSMDQETSGQEVIMIDDGAAGNEPAGDSAGDSAGDEPEAGDSAGDEPEAGDSAGDSAGDEPEAGDSAGDEPEAGEEPNPEEGPALSRQIPEGVCEGVWQCAPGEGCADERCGACERSSDCAEEEVCDEGVCGRCEADAECDMSERCVEGACLPTEPQTWEIIISDEDWGDLMRDPYGDTEYPCGLRVNGTERVNLECKIKIRGGSSRDYPKRSFRIKCPSGSDHPGLTRKINLRAEYNDTTKMRNYLSHHVGARLTRLPFPELRYIQLYRGGERLGLYAEVERIGGPFRRRVKHDDDAPLYEADPPLALFSTGVGSLVPLPDVETYEDAFDMKEGDDHQPLIDWIEGPLQDAYEALTRDEPATPHLERSLYIDDYIDYLAFMLLIQNHDMIRKNYYLALQPTSSESDGSGTGWFFYPWDLDLTWGCLYDNDVGDTICDSFVSDANPRFGTLPDGVGPVYPVEAFFNLLQHIVMTDEELSARLTSRLCGWLDSDYWRDEVPALINAMRAYLGPYVMAETESFDTRPEAFMESVDELLLFHELREVTLREAFGCAQP